MSYTLGIDFGTDSVRALLIDAQDGTEVATGVSHYPRWQRGEFCDATTHRFRQHPLDYLESMTAAVRTAIMGGAAGEQILGIGIDTTGSTPVAVDRSGSPLALRPRFADHPNAMFVLWKDHTATAEAEEINQLCHTGPVDYTKYCGGVYSSEWFWAKLLHIVRDDSEIAAVAYSWVEHCDWIPFHLSGGDDVHRMKRSRCAAGHKALWHPDWDGLPPEDFLTSLDPKLAGLRDRLYTDTYTSDEVAGHLSDAWAERLGLPAGIPIAVGAFDAHMGAVGGNIRPFYFSRIMGTSTCDILVVPPEHPAASRLVRGICGQVDGSVVPGMLGLEAGQSAFGDVYAWFARLLAWPLEQLLPQVTEAERAATLAGAVEDRLIPALSRAAAALEPDEKLIALDWLNGRRTPDADQTLQGAMAGLHLGTDAPRLFRALVEATCYGSRVIVERFLEEGIPIEGIIALGGVAKKNPFVVQTLADVLNRPIQVVASEQTCALGAGLFAAVAAGLYPDILTASQRLASGYAAEYSPRPDYVARYDRLYLRYQALARTAESLAHA